MIRPNFRLAAGALLLCLGVKGVSQEPNRYSTEPSQRKVPTKAVLPDPNRNPGGSELAPLRPEAVSSLIPVKPSERKPKPIAPSERRPEIVALPALPPVKVPLHGEPLAQANANGAPDQRIDDRPIPPVPPKGEVRPLGKESPATVPKQKLPTRTGKALLRDVEDEATVPVSTPEPVSPRQPTAIDPKEMAPIQGGNVKMPALAKRSGISDTPTSPLQDFNAAYIRRLAIEGGVNELLAAEIGGIVEQKRTGDPTALKKAVRCRSDAWLVRSCEELKDTAEAEKPVAFQEMLRVHKRMRATETPATK